MKASSLAGSPQRRAVHPEFLGEAHFSPGSPGFIHLGDMKSDYRGEVKVILANLGQEPFAVRRGDRIAQLVPAPVLHATLAEVASLDETARGSGGFGSTGL